MKTCATSYIDYINLTYIARLKYSTLQDSYPLERANVCLSRVNLGWTILEQKQTVYIGTFLAACFSWTTACKAL